MTCSDIHHNHELGITTGADGVTIFGHDVVVPNVPWDVDDPHPDNDDDDGCKKEDRKKKDKN